MTYYLSPVFNSLFYYSRCNKYKQFVCSNRLGSMFEQPSQERYFGNAWDVVLIFLVGSCQNTAHNNSPSILYKHLRGCLICRYSRLVINGMREIRCIFADMYVQQNGLIRAYMRGYSEGKVCRNKLCVGACVGGRSLIGNIFPLLDQCLFIINSHNLGIGNNPAFAGGFER